MSDNCFDCKYHSSVDGMEACAYESGLMAHRIRCDRYTRSWSKWLSLKLTVALFIFLILYVIIAPILLLLGVVKV